MARFAHELRALRAATGLSYRELGRRAHYSATTLSIAASGKNLPSLAVTLAYVAACGGDVDVWRDRWNATRDEVRRAERATHTSTPSTTSTPVPAPVPDPRPPAPATATTRAPSPVAAVKAPPTGGRAERPQIRLATAAAVLTAVLVSSAWLVAMTWPRPGSATTPGTTTTVPNGTAPVTTTRAGPPSGVVDLTVRGPDRVVLQPSDGEYAATFSVTVYNRTDLPYGYTVVSVDTPAGVTVESEDFGGCLGAGCSGQAVPAGGSRMFQVHVQVSIAPAAKARTVTGFRIGFAANDNQANTYLDPNPLDNTLAVTLVLAAAGAIR